jgi:outer membrane protein OmpA-like peptidoglycan-associated protein
MPRQTHPNRFRQMGRQLGLLAIGLFVSMLTPIAGCGLPLQGQLARNEAEKMQLLAQLRQEQLRLAAAESSRLTLEARLAEAEKDAARLSDRRNDDGPASDRHSTEAAGWQQRSTATGLRSLAERHPGLKTIGDAAIAPGELGELSELSEIGALDTSILFAAGRADLRPDAIAALDEQMKLLHAASGAGLRIVVAGHADDRSETGAAAGDATEKSTTGQLEISAARAAEVAAWLRRRGIAEENIVTLAVGARQPCDDGASPAGQAKNRRAEIFLAGPQTPLLGADWRPSSRR